MSETPHVSATIPDWSREEVLRWNDYGARLLRAIRQYQRWKKKSGLFARLMTKLCVARYEIWTVVTGTDIPLHTEIGGGLRMPHPNGIVINGSAVIGPNCLIFQQVTITDRVELAGHVDVGAGAKILPAVKVGPHALIGANAVVVSDVPAHATAIGVPARLIERDESE